MRRGYLFDQAIIALLVALSVQLSMPAAHGQEDISKELSRAESLYYEAEFQSSLDLLLSLEKRVAIAGRRDDQLKIDFYLSLVYLGLSQQEIAKSKMVKVCSVDPHYAPNSSQYSPKVNALFEDAKATCRENHCEEICRPAVSLIKEGRLDAAEARLRTASHSCPCAVAAAGAINEARLLEAKKLYANEKFAEAAKAFGAILDSDKNHQIAREYLGLSRQRLEFSAAQFAFSQWREAFNSRRFTEAALAYEKLRSASSEPTARQLARTAESEYQTALSALAGSWKTACENRNRTKMDQLRQEAVNLASGQAFGTDTLLQMQQCTPRPCLFGDPALAMRRLRTRVNPQIDANLWPYLAQARVNIEIDQTGAVTVKNVSNADGRFADELKTALEKWKFYPAILDNQARCVETQLPISLIQP